MTERPAVTDYFPEQDGEPTRPAAPAPSLGDRWPTAVPPAAPAPVAGQAPVAPAYPPGLSPQQYPPVGTQSYPTRVAGPSAPLPASSAPLAAGGPAPAGAPGGRRAAAGPPQSAFQPLTSPAPQQPAPPAVQQMAPPTGQPVGAYAPQTAAPRPVANGALPGSAAPTEVRAPAPTTTRAPAAATRAPERSARVGLSQALGEGDLDLDSALRKMIEVGASDLHITSGAQPTIRLDGQLKPLDGFGTLMPDSIQRTIYAVLTQKQRETFEENLELDFAYAVRGVARFRVNLYQQRDSLGAAFRVIPYEIKPLEALGVPAVVSNFANLPRGLVLVTGPTGSGKSTTLAAIIDLANRTRSDHIMTVEDPIEFLHRHKKS
ncbi:MAG TPA: ATPase, T2SS/T4P/T4SS family, partial [Actinotalea sp.]